MLGSQTWHVRANAWQTDPCLKPMHAGLRRRLVHRMIGSKACASRSILRALGTLHPVEDETHRGISSRFKAGGDMIFKTISIQANTVLEFMQDQFKAFLLERMKETGGVKCNSFAMRLRLLSRYMPLQAASVPGVVNIVKLPTIW